MPAASEHVGLANLGILFCDLVSTSLCVICFLTVLVAWIFPLSFCGVLGFGCVLLSAPPPVPPPPAWLLETSAFTSHGRRGTRRHRPAVCIAGLALGDIDLAFAWHAFRGRRCVADVTLGNIDFYFVWQAWHLVIFIFTLYSRRGTWRHRPSIRVADMALDDIDLHFTWKAWRLVTFTLLCAADVFFMVLGQLLFWWCVSLVCLIGLALGNKYPLRVYVIGMMFGVIDFQFTC